MTMDWRLGIDNDVPADLPRRMGAEKTRQSPGGSGETIGRIEF